MFGRTGAADYIGPVTSDSDARAEAHIGHDVVVTGPGVDPRRRWAYLALGVVIFMAAIFGLSRLGAEHGNEVRFGFPDKVEGLRLTKPDRAPEARNKEILTHYDRRGDGLATLVVEWLPSMEVEQAVGAATGDDEITCISAPEVTCATKVRDGVVRVTQRSSDERDVRDFVQSFLAERKEPDSRG